jgi:enediyne biosynthesis protein E4
MNTRRRFVVGLLLVAAITAIGGYAALRALQVRRDEASFAQAKREMAAGNYDTAKKRLIELASSFSHEGEVEYLIGDCDLRRGHPVAALAAWRRVPQSSRFASRAAAQVATGLIDSGEFTHAEQILLAARLRETGPDSLVLLQKLATLYEVEGRTDEMRAALVESWRYTESPISLLKQLARQETARLALGTIRRLLEQRDSDDDRLWLGRANLAIRTGRLDEAARWLDACLKRRPDDSIVWKARLELATTSGDLTLGWQALEHLPATGVSSAEVARIRAWIAACEDDNIREGSALEELVKLDPGDTTALNRMAALATRAGDKARLESIRAKIAATSAVKIHYQSLTQNDSSGTDPAELARLAEMLGRADEAQGWALIRDGKLGRSGSTRLGLLPAATPEAARPHGSNSGPMLADLCADLRTSSKRPPIDRNAPAMPRYVDDAVSAGLRFFHDNAGSPRKRPPETMSGGLALLDYDGDGLLDVYAVQGGPLPPEPRAHCEDRLFRNRGDGTFEDSSERAGLRRLPGGYGHGVAVGDYDNDGDPDLFVTRWNAYALLRNRGDGTFEDATTAAGLGGDRDWPTSAAWADLDGDGDLDLYVCHYLVFDLDSPTICHSSSGRGNHYCSPRDFPARPDHVFRNDGGRFIDVTSQAGFIDPDGRGLGVVAADFDGDNRIDVYVANDMSANYLFRNLGGFRFEETALMAGSAANSSGSFQAGMGVACGDLDADGTPDLAVTNFYGESTTFFRNLGRGIFADDTASVGLAAPSRWLLGFGVAFLDANNDGWLDLISANGHVNDHRPAFPWRMPTQLLLGGPGGRLNAPAPRAGDPFEPLHLGRGLAVGDLDNDGRIDAVVQSQNEPLAYLHNQTDRGGHWVTFHLEGVRSNRDGVGARIRLWTGPRQRVAQRIGGGSYQSASDPRLHFGLGDSVKIDRLEIRWPSQTVDSYSGLKADRGYRLREGAATAEPLQECTHPRD